MSILDDLKVNIGKAIRLKFMDDSIVPARIDEIYEDLNAVKFINGKGLNLLRELKMRDKATFQAEQEIIQNPLYFSVMPIKEIKQVMTD